jgi:hypothetical protein
MYILNLLLRQETVGGLTMSVTDFNAVQKWAKLTKDKQQLLVLQRKFALAP